MLRVGIISANWGAFAHLPAWRSLPGVAVTAICTSRRETAEAAAARHAIPRPFWDAAAMIDDPDIDVVDCGTRPNVRHPMVLAALTAGKHVYGGIPFAAGLEQARALHTAWAGGPGVGVVDAYAQWLPAFRQAKAVLDEGRLGQPFGGLCSFTMPLFNQPDPAFPYNWFAQPGAGVSALRNLGSHALHLLLHLFGPVAEVAGVDRRLLDRWEFPDGTALAPQNNDHAALVLRFASGLVLPLQISWSAPLGAGFLLDAWGSGGRMTVTAPSFPTPAETRFRFGALGEREPAEVAPPPALLRPPGIALAPDMQPQASWGMATAMQAMVRAIRDGTPAAPDFAQAWAVERVLEAARRASATRAWIALDEVQ